MIISVIIPTYNRCLSLKKSLDSLMRQSIPSLEYEILVVNDGSTDQTKEFMMSLISVNKNIFYFEQNKKGPAAARNTGIKHAKGKYLFFTGDDIIASYDLLKTHLGTLETHKNTAILGFTIWDTSINVSKFMNFLIDRGHQFDYRGLSNGQYCSWGLFYTSNVSLERHWLETELFAEDMPYPSWEDIELAYRLHKKGLKIIFNKHALAFHDHVITEKDFYTKTKQGGISRIYFYNKHPDLKTFAFKISKTKSIFFLSKGIPFCTKILKFFRLKVLAWELNLWYYTILGIHQGRENS